MCDAHRGARTFAAPQLAPAHALCVSANHDEITLLHSSEGRPSFYPTAAVQHRGVLALYRVFGQSSSFCLTRMLAASMLLRAFFTRARQRRICSLGYELATPV